MTSPNTFLILGHSFTRRLQEWCVRNQVANLNLDPNRAQIFWHGTGGATVTDETGIKSTWRDISLISDLEVSVTFLDIGSNDLTHRGVTPEKLADCISAFADAILGKGCPIVIISEILNRSHSPHFNEKADAVNYRLAEKCAENPRLIFWLHSTNNFNVRFIPEYVSRDGIHVDNTVGMPRYYSMPKHNPRTTRSGKRKAPAQEREDPIDTGGTNRLALLIATAMAKDQAIMKEVVSLVPGAGAGTSVEETPAANQRLDDKSIKVE